MRILEADQLRKEIPQIS